MCSGNVVLGISKRCLKAGGINLNALFPDPPKIHGGSVASRVNRRLDQEDEKCCTIEKRKSGQSHLKSDIEGDGILPDFSI